MIVKGNPSFAIAGSFLLAFFAFNSVSGCGDTTFLSERNGQYLKDHVIDTMTTETISLCRMMCYLNDSCMSYNYQPSTGTCEINDSDEYQHDNDLVTKQDHVYVGRKNACQNKPCSHRGTCKPNFADGTHTCECASGFEGSSCNIDIDECSDRRLKCPVHATCVNTEGSYKCKCNKGFFMSAKRDVCWDINECFTRKHNCSNTTMCSNRKGSFECVCRYGYHGSNCTDIDECLIKEFQVCPSNCTCQNLEGNFKCLCNDDNEDNHSINLRGLENSTILNYHNDKRNFKLKKTLSSYLEPVLQSPNTSRWIRCWHVTPDGWGERNSFHPNCDGKGPTVTIVRVGDYVFGGYTSASWQKHNTYSNSSSSFLFSLYNINGYKPVKLNIRSKTQERNAIRGGSYYGPIFGSGHDLRIENPKSNQVSSSRCNSYNCPPGCKRSNYCSYFFTGSLYYFKPNETEVFYEKLDK